MSPLLVKNNTPLSVPVTSPPPLERGARTSQSRDGGSRLLITCTHTYCHTCTYIHLHAITWLLHYQEASTVKPPNIGLLALSAMFRSLAPLTEPATSKTYVAAFASVGITCDIVGRAVQTSAASLEDAPLHQDGWMKQWSSHLLSAERFAGKKASRKHAECNCNSNACQEQ